MQRLHSASRGFRLTGPEGSLLPARVARWLGLIPSAQEAVSRGADRVWRHFAPVFIDCGESRGSVLPAALPARAQAGSSVPLG